MPPQSHANVIVICDFCGEEYVYKYQNYSNRCSPELGDACPKCKYKKMEQSIKIKYGVDCVFQSEEVKDKIRKTNKEKYGVEYYSQTKECKMKVANTYLNHVKDNSIHVPTSSQQLEIFKMLKENYKTVELNYPCGRCFLDCMVEINNIKIDVEYDGIFWHTGKEDYDRRRNYYVISQGYKILRIKGKHKVPNLEILKEAIDKLLKQENNFLEIYIE